MHIFIELLCYFSLCKSACTELQSFGVVLLVFDQIPEVRSVLTSVPQFALQHQIWKWVWSFCVQSVFANMRLQMFKSSAHLWTTQHFTVCMRFKHGGLLERLRSALRLWHQVWTHQPMGDVTGADGWCHRSLLHMLPSSMQHCFVTCSSHVTFLFSWQSLANVHLQKESLKLAGLESVSISIPVSFCPSSLLLSLPPHGSNTAPLCGCCQLQTKLWRYTDVFTPHSQGDEERHRSPLPRPLTSPWVSIPPLRIRIFLQPLIHSAASPCAGVQPRFSVLGGCCWRLRDWCSKFKAEHDVIWQLLLKCWAAATYFPGCRAGAAAVTIYFMKLQTLQTSCNRLYLLIS